MAAIAAQITIEIALALPEEQLLVEVTLDAGVTVAGATTMPDVVAQLAGHDVASMPVGIWGHLVDRDRVLKHGDRLEFYRPLQIDPRDMRRKLAQSGRTMGPAGK